jgi:hypothetical protein
VIKSRWGALRFVKLLLFLSDEGGSAEEGSESQGEAIFVAAD